MKKVFVAGGKNHVHYQADRQLAALLALTVLSGCTLNGREPNFETVSLYLNIEKNDAFVTGLDEDNFRLHEDGQALPFRIDAPEAPASIALLVEYSQFSADSSAVLP
jgi:hypothetical protein